MDETFKHTTAAEMEEFLARSPSEQALRIWLSARETNGHVADAQRAIAAQGKEIQAARYDLSEHLRDHVTIETVARVNDMWRWFDRSRFFLVGVIPAMLLLQPTFIALALWILER